MALMAADRSPAPGFGAALLASILQCSDAAIAGLSPDGVIETWNDGAELLYGYRAEEALGQAIAILEPSDQPAITEHVNSARARGTVRFETTHIRRDDTPVDVEVTISPVRLGGSLAGLAYLARDVSERRRAERELERLGQAAEHAHEASSRSISTAVCVIGTPAHSACSAGARPKRSGARSTIWP